MKEQLQKLRDTLLERVPHKNYSPAQKAARTKRAAIAGCVVSVLLLVVLVVALFPVTDVQIVSNDSHYTDQELLDALDTSGWTPVLNVTPRIAEQRLMDNLLNLDSA